MLVIANQTILGEPLLAAIRERAQPRRPSSRSWPRGPGGCPRTGCELALAQLRGAGSRQRATSATPTRSTAALNVVHDEQVDEIIVSTFPDASSGWLRRDVVGRIFDVVKAGNVARLGYMDFSSVTEVFPMRRPRWERRLTAGDEISRLPPPAPRQQALGPPQMRPVVHLAVDADDAGIAGVRECLDDGLRARPRPRPRRERGVDDRHLCRVDRQLGGEAVALGLQAFPPQPVGVAEIDEHGVDRGDIGDRCARGSSSRGRGGRRRCSGRSRRAWPTRRSLPTGPPRPRSAPARRGLRIARRLPPRARRPRSR